MTKMRWKPALRRTLPSVLGLFMAASAGAQWLLLRDGTRVDTAGPWELRGRVVVFLQTNGTLASIRATEVDLEASRATRWMPPAPSAVEPSEPSADDPENAGLLAPSLAASEVQTSEVVAATNPSEQSPTPLPSAQAVVGAIPAQLPEPLEGPTPTAEEPTAAGAPRDEAARPPAIATEVPPPSLPPPSGAQLEPPPSDLRDNPLATSPRPEPLDGAPLEIDESRAPGMVDDGGARVVEWRAAQRQAGGLTISGRLAGPSSGTATDLALTVRLVDRAGVPLASEPAQLSTRRLDAGQEGLFRAHFAGEVRYQRVEFDVHSLFVAVVETE